MNPPFFAYIAAGTSLLPTIAGIYYWKRLSAHYKILTIYFIYNVADLVIEYLMGRLGIYTQSLINYHDLIELECFIYFYYKWSELKTLRVGIKYTAFSYLFFWIGAKVYLADPGKLDSLIVIVSSIILVLISIGVLYEMIKFQTVLFYQSSIFWIGTSIFIYFSGTVILFAYTSTIITMGITDFNTLWNINWSLTVISNAMFALGFSSKLLR
jgi:hypothetical protein